ncbi:MAG: 16S rRNA (uracil(1498)-N(3))-methyltransferase [Erysipelotrichia bacterium]|jgi:16S rRNA (uracil1498-N3)-methyltransferase|nr:16S rRNA (uracil(1498)-N(3))-methyltransferase [Erysipelotrichia bacterium]
MQRYFARLDYGLVILEEDDLFHLHQVMRLKVGDEIEVVIENKLYLAKIFSIKPSEIKIIKELDVSSEPNHHVTLMFSPLKGQKTELVLQKATELGVSEIILVVSQRTIVRYKQNDLAKKIIRYQKIIKEASEQSKRLTIPKIKYYCDFDKALNITADLKLIANEELVGPTNSFNELIVQLKKDQKIALLIGPEGGFTKEEVVLAYNQSFLGISLGQRILRAETAALYALSVIINKLEYK